MRLQIPRLPVSNPEVAVAAAVEHVTPLAMFAKSLACINFSGLADYSYSYSYRYAVV